MKIFDKLFGKKEYKRLFQNGDVIYVKEDKFNVKEQQNRFYAYAKSYGFKISLTTGLFLDTRRERIERVIRVEYMGDEHKHGVDAENQTVAEGRKVTKQLKYETIMKLRDEGLTYKEIGRELNSNPNSLAAFVCYMKRGGR